MKRITSIVESKCFTNLILVIILLNSLILGLQTSPEIVASIGTYLAVIDNIFLGIFVIELILKIIVHKLNFFKSGFNIFDFLIVIVSVLSELSFLSVFRILRVFRVLRSLRNLRALRMISGVSKLNVIITAIGKSIPSIAWTGLLLIIIYYVFAVMGTVCFGEAFPEWFGNIGSSFYTLFQVMTLESWSMGISRPVMETFSWAWLYFVPFVLISAFIMMNVVVGIVVNTISESAESNQKDELKEGEKHSGDALRKELEILKSQVKKVELLLDDYEQI